MNLTRRVEKLQAATHPRQEGPQIVILWTDGATVDGEDMSLGEYERRWPDGPGAGTYILRVGLNCGDI